MSIVWTRWHLFESERFFVQCDPKPGCNVKTKQGVIFNIFIRNNKNFCSTSAPTTHTVFVNVPSGIVFTFPRHRNIVKHFSTFNIGQFLTF